MVVACFCCCVFSLRRQPRGPFLLAQFKGDVGKWGWGGGAFRPHHATLASANSLRSTVGRAHQHKGTDGRTDKLTDGQTDGRSDRRTDGWIDVRVGRASSLVPTPIGRIIAEGCWVGSGYFSTFQSGHFPKPLEVHETRFIITPRKGAKHDLERTTIITY